MAWKTVYEKHNYSKDYPYLSIVVKHDDEEDVAVIKGYTVTGSIAFSTKLWNTVAQTVDDYTKAIDWGIEIIEQWFTKWELEQEVSKNA